MPFEVEPSPSVPPPRFGAPEEAQDASYLAASARMRSLRASLGSIGTEYTFFFCSNKVLARTGTGQTGAFRRGKSPPVQAVSGTTGLTRGRSSAGDVPCPSSGVWHKVGPHAPLVACDGRSE